MVGTSINLFSLLSKLTIIEVKKTFMSFLKFSELKLSTLNKKWIFFWVNEIQNYLLISSQVFDVWKSQIKCLFSHKIRVSKACWRKLLKHNGFKQPKLDIAIRLGMCAKPSRVRAAHQEVTNHKKCYVMS